MNRKLSRSTTFLTCLSKSTGGFFITKDRDMSWTITKIDYKWLNESFSSSTWALMEWFNHSNQASWFLIVKHYEGTMSWLVRPVEFDLGHVVSSSMLWSCARILDQCEICDMRPTSTCLRLVLNLPARLARALSELGNTTAFKLPGLPQTNISSGPT
jgi:hypothetical protein